MRTRLPLLFVVLLLAVAVGTWKLAPRLLPGLRGPAAARVRALPSLAGVAAWPVGPPLTADSLRGRPVVLLLWSDSDPRGLAALAVAEAWHRAYAPLGARIVAVHAPEFAFGAQPGIAAGVARRMGLTLPVADDPANTVSSLLRGATDGPHLVVANERGAIVADTVGVLGPGDAALRAWAARVHPDAAPPMLSLTLPTGVRTVSLAAGDIEAGPLHGLAAGHREVFTAQFRYQEAGEAWTPYPVGGWELGSDGLTATRAGAANFVAIRYSAGRAGVVASPPPGAVAKLWILRDEQWPRAADRGDDVREGDRGSAYVEIGAPGIYWLDRGNGTRVLKLSPDVAGVMVHAFVFEDAR